MELSELEVNFLKWGLFDRTNVVHVEAEEVMEKFHIDRNQYKALIQKMKEIGVIDKVWGGRGLEPGNYADLFTFQSRAILQEIYDTIKSDCEK